MGRVCFENVTYEQLLPEGVKNILPPVNQTFYSHQSYYFSDQIQTHLIVDLILNLKKPSTGKINRTSLQFSYQFLGWFDGSEVSMLAEWRRTFGKEYTNQMLQKFCPFQIYQSILKQEFTTEALEWIAYINPIFFPKEYLFISGNFSKYAEITKNYSGIKFFILDSSQILAREVLWENESSDQSFDHNLIH